MSQAFLRQVLLPLTIPTSWLYGTVVAVRNGLYGHGLFKSLRLPAPVISVGNLTLGGTGKTPLVALIARYFLSKGQPVAVVSRGYGRRDSASIRLVSDGGQLLVDASEGGDEPVELARNVERLVVAVGADRYRTALEVMDRMGPHLFVLDDGFQHRRLSRNLDLVCIDSGESAANLRLLPAGRLREPVSALNRAGGIIWTRWRSFRPSDELASRVLGALRNEVPIFRSTQAPAGFSRLAGEPETLGEDGFRGESVGVLAAVAQPERLREDLEASGAQVVWFVAKRDHHEWQPGEVAGLLEKARARGASAVITTGKDAVKLAAPLDSPLPLYQMDLRVEIQEREAFEALLDSVPLPKTDSGL